MLLKIKIALWKLLKTDDLKIPTSYAQGPSQIFQYMYSSLPCSADFVKKLSYNPKQLPQKTLTRYSVVFDLCVCDFYDQ